MEPASPHTMLTYTLVPVAIINVTSIADLLCQSMLRCLGTVLGLPINNSAIIIRCRLSTPLCHTNCCVQRPVVTGGRSIPTDPWTHRFLPDQHLSKYRLDLPVTRFIEWTSNLGHVQARIPWFRHHLAKDPCKGWHTILEVQTKVEPILVQGAAHSLSGIMRRRGTVHVGRLVSALVMPGR